jgi:5-oxopent-3-ene-1,2,5-tricarboxylate decarboxylase/2-hydroxyhepta-2,4-diene-1,7-dioate isomerase
MENQTMTTIRFHLSGCAQAEYGEAHPEQYVFVFRHRQIHISEAHWHVPVNGTVYGTLFNFKGALKAMGNAVYEPPYHQPPQGPILYIKPKNTHIAYGQPIPLPPNVYQVVIGASLGVVMGRTATRVPVKEALHYVEGYTIVNDVSIPHQSVYRPPIVYNARDGFCPIGPWVVQRECVSNPDQLKISVYINDQLVQENTTANLIRSIPQLIAEVSQFMTLYPGDTLLVGCPEHPPLAKEGDQVRIEIEQIGSLQNYVVKQEQ